MKLIFLFLTINIILSAESLIPLTILIDFPDYKYTELESREWELTNNRRGDEFTRELYADMFYSEETYKAYNGEDLMSARGFFHSESGGTFSLEGNSEDIYGWFTAEREMAFYGKDSNGAGNAARASFLVREGIKKLVEARVDFSRYDSNGDGIIDNVVVIFAGRGQQFDNSMGDKSIWPHYNTFSDAIREPYAYFDDHNGRSWAINSFMLLPQDVPLDLYVHEMGHYLGISDLYGEHSTVGYWSNMSEIYCGEITGTKINSYGAYHRNNLQNIYNDKNIQTYWAQTKEYDKEDIQSKDITVRLYTSNHKKNDNIIKVNLPNSLSVVPTNGKETYYSDNYLNKGSSFTLTVSLPHNMDNRLLMEAWFNSNLDRENNRVYIKPIREKKWEKLNNVNGLRGKPERWIQLEYDLNKYNGQVVQIMGQILPSIKEWRKGVYLSDLRVTSDRNRIFDLKVDRNKIIFDGFRKTSGREKQERYLLMEYRYPKEGEIDEGLLKTRKDIPYPSGLLVWYIDDSYNRNEQLVNILPASGYNQSVHEVIKGKVIPLEEIKYQVSTSVISSKGIPRTGVKKEGRYYYRETIPPIKRAELIDGIAVNILEENESYILVNISFN